MKPRDGCVCDADLRFLCCLFAPRNQTPWFHPSPCASLFDITLMSSTSPSSCPETSGTSKHAARQFTSRGGLPRGWPGKDLGGGRGGAGGGEIFAAGARAGDKAGVGAAAGDTTGGGAGEGAGADADAGATGPGAEVGGAIGAAATAAVGTADTAACAAVVGTAGTTPPCGSGDAASEVSGI